MEVIEFPGYILEEKIKIATNYLIPKLLKRHGLNKKYFKLDKKILATIIDKYARDPGARFLEKALSKLMRKVAMSIAKKDKIIKNFKISDIEKYLGPEVFKNETYRRVTEPGVVVGLAWTAYGGDILFIESSAISNDKPQFKYTGQLGDVMKESALISYTYAKKWISLNSKNSFFNENDIHLHIPAGAIPKDGPSAGITMCMSLISLAYNKKLPVDLAMTGELSIVGKVLPVGGIKEKLIAAVRSGIKKVIIPSENEKDIKEVPDNIKNKLKLYYVKEMKDVIKICFKN
jgi:ATP-dependent Lon protease